MKFTIASLLLLVFLATGTAQADTDVITGKEWKQFSFAMKAAYVRGYLDGLTFGCAGDPAMDSKEGKHLHATMECVALLTMPKPFPSVRPFIEHLDKHYATFTDELSSPVPLVLEVYIEGEGSKKGEVKP